MRVVTVTGTTRGCQSLGMTETSQRSFLSLFFIFVVSCEWAREWHRSVSKWWKIALLAINSVIVGRQACGVSKRERQKERGSIMGPDPNNGQRNQQEISSQENDWQPQGATRISCARNNNQSNTSCDRWLPKTITETSLVQTDGKRISNIQNDDDEPWIWLGGERWERGQRELGNGDQPGDKNIEISNLICDRNRDAFDQ